MFRKQPDGSRKQGLKAMRRRSSTWGRCFGMPSYRRTWRLACYSSSAHTLALGLAWDLGKRPKRTCMPPSTSPLTL